jgi:bacillolysin
MSQRVKMMAVLVSAAVVTAGQAAWAGPRPAPENPGVARLTDDATAGLRLERDADGVVGFVGTSAGNAIVNSSVSAGTDVRQAARSHLSRYGAALGASDAELAVSGAPVRATSGQDVVRFQQQVDSAPVIGSQVVVSLRGDRQLTSMLATLSTVRDLPSPAISQADASATAARTAALSAAADGLTVTPQGRAVWDPAVFGARGSARGVWRFEVGDGAAVRRLVLVDDTTGRVLVDLDQIEHLDRVVCDRANARGAATPCTSGFARTEASGPSAVTDVNAAFDHAGSTATAFSEIAGVDLTDLIGIDVGGVKKLASTVRFCDNSNACPYANAFWNGAQMFYGDGFAGADDVVGHEMTHGFIDRHSELFYWGQSGAINESMADILGEVVDQRAGLVPADADWLLGEDLPIGAIRNMADPTVFGDPDRMTSPLWFADTATYGDGGGMHVNSGVGNKTAHLISQGGTFNGQAITGIDGSDTGLTKTGMLYIDAITKLTSGSDYADLGAVLEQGCADFVSSGIGSFTPSDCATVAQAVLATELRTTPTNAPQPPDAVRECPTGTTLRELFDSESGTPADKFASSVAGTWGYGVNSIWGSNATSGRDSWFGYNLDGYYGEPTSASLTMADGIALPAGQPSYLAFEQWRLFQWYPEPTPRYIDGGTVEVDAGGGAVDTATLPWTNGPQQVLESVEPADPNEWAGRQAFAGDSFGWTTSRLDLSSLAGQTVRPSFTLRSDAVRSLIGWWLDDIQVYTCDPVPVPTPSTPPSTPPSAEPTQTPVPALPVPSLTKATSTTRLAVRTGTRIKLIATVRSDGASVTGKVTFAVDRRKIVTTRTLTKGKAVVLLTAKQVAKLGRGKHTVRVLYRGSDTVERSGARGSFRLR